MNETARNSDEREKSRSPEKTPKPPWLKVRMPSDAGYFQVSEILRTHRLHTICQSARCPNVGECWSRKTATFLILGDTCTRDCGFCAVKKGRPSNPDADEPGHVAGVVRELGLKYAVVTSVTRDDLPDGGASAFARTIRAIRDAAPSTKIEVLIPDFGGSRSSLDTVLDARPDILNHNLETIESLYPAIRRPAANYRRSLDLLDAAKKKGAMTKSGLMIGLGERYEEIIGTLSDLRRIGCDLLTIGQYLRPTPENHPVEKYYSPLEFVQIRDIALDFGFADAAAGPLVRSSYQAEKLFLSARDRM